MHQRYVDDTNIAAKETEVGARYDGEKLIMDATTIQEDAGIPADERTMRILQQVAGHIHPSIRLTIDYPSRHANGKVPMLDIQMWIAEINGVKKIMYEHYEKEMTTKAVIHEKSAISTQTKRTVLSQEILRILLHCCEYLKWEDVCVHINNFLKKMQYSGYSKPFRYNAVNSALNTLKIIKQKKELGIRPINRTKDWRWEERAKEKEEKKTVWYKNGGFDSVLFIPSTPEGKLKSMYQHEIARSGMRIKVIEKTGATLKSRLQVSNPFKTQRCGRESCFVCTSGGTGNCNSEGITYNLKCKTECETKDIYRGESSGNAYTRGDEHLTNLNNRDLRQSPLWRH